MKKLHIALLSTAVLLLVRKEKFQSIYDAANKIKRVSKSILHRFLFLIYHSDGGNWLFDTSVGDLRVYERGSKSRWFFKCYRFEFYYFKLWWNEITGYLQNLKFKKTDSDSIHTLTDKPALILTATTFQRYLIN
jgi:hypothetical protein